MGNVWTLVGLLAAGLTSTSFVPQVWLKWKRPGQARVSYATVGLFVAGACMWTAYGLHVRDAIIVGANLFIIANLMVLAVLQGLEDLGRRGTRIPAEPEASPHADARPATHQRSTRHVVEETTPINKI